MVSDDHARKMTERLLALALEARRRGEVDLANQLTLRAAQYLDEADGAADPHDPPPSATPQEQPQQQPQKKLAGENDG